MAEGDQIKPASVVVPSVVNEGEGSATSVDETQLQAAKPKKKAVVKASGNCVPEAYYWSIDEVASWIEDIGYWQYKVGYGSSICCLKNEHYTCTLYICS